MAEATVMPDSALCGRRELVRSAEPGAEDTAVTVSVTPTIFRAEITGSKGLLATRGASPIADPR